MDAIIVDNEPFAATLRQHFNIPHVCRANDPREIAAEVVELRKSIKADGDKAPIFINVEGRLDKIGKRQEQKGVDILLWLRCKQKVVNPVILYSFQPNHLLLKKKPENLVINSEGCYYVQLPNDFGLLSRDLSGMKDLNALKRYLGPAFNIEQFRHREANWWGVVQLVDVHRSLYPSEIGFRDAAGHPIQYPTGIQEILDTLDNTKAVFLYGHKGFDTVFNEIKCQELEAENRRILHQIREIEKKLTLTRRRNPRPDQVIDFIADRQQLIEMHRNNHSWITSTKPIIDEQLAEANQMKQVLAAKLEQLRQQHTRNVGSIKNMRLGSRTIDATTVANEISKLRAACRKAKILYIDDQAKEGWEDVLKLILSSNGTGCFESVEIHQPSSVREDITDTIGEIARSAASKILSINPDLILLDVRLVPEYDKRLAHDVQHLSGALVLQKIRTFCPGIPIIIATASNKAWTYMELLRLGADAYWIKEGVDEGRTAEESVRNYIRLLNFIETLTSDKYKILKELGSRIEQLKEGHDMWWKKEIDWSLLGGNKNNMNLLRVPVKTTPDAGAVLSILDDSFLLLREYLQRTELKNQYDPFDEKAWVLPTMIMQHSGKIIEIIHDFMNYEKTEYFSLARSKGLVHGFTPRKTDVAKMVEFKIDASKLQRERNGLVPVRRDIKGFKIFDERNEASHTKRLREINFKRLVKFLDDLLRYLSNPPDSCASGSIVTLDQFFKHPQRKFDRGKQRKNFSKR